jgi:hypothetical protein
MGWGSGQWGSSWILARHGVGGSWERYGSDITLGLPFMHMHVPPHMFSPHMVPPAFPPAYHPMHAWTEDQMRIQVQLQHEMMQLSQNMKSLQEENVRLRVQLMEERETKYSTPPDGRSLEKSLRSIDKHIDKRKKGGLESSKPKEDGSRGQQDLKQEDGPGTGKSLKRRTGPGTNKTSARRTGPGTNKIAVRRMGPETDKTKRRKRAPRRRK